MIHPGTQAHTVTRAPLPLPRSRPLSPSPRYDNPSLLSSDAFGARPVVNANGGGKVTIVGRYLFIANSTVETRVTIGGDASGVPIPTSDVVLGTGSPPGGRRLSTTDQYLIVTMPPWQGTRVPLVVFKVYSSGNAAFSSPYYVDFARPSLTSAAGSTGNVTLPTTPVTARTNGTSRVRLAGDNIGQVGTSILLTNSAPEAASHVFTDCDRGFGFVECTAPAGVGLRDSEGTPWSMQVLQPGLTCAESLANATVNHWSTCTVVTNPADLQSSGVCVVMCVWGVCVVMRVYGEYVWW